MDVHGLRYVPAVPVAAVRRRHHDPIFVPGLVAGEEGAALGQGFPTRARPTHDSDPRNRDQDSHRAGITGATSRDLN